MLNLTPVKGNLKCSFFQAISICYLGLFLGIVPTTQANNASVNNINTSVVLMDFEDTNRNYDVFGFGSATFGPITAEVIDNPDVNGVNTSARVVHINKPTGAQPWAGAATPLDGVIDFSEGTNLSLKVWSPRVGVPIRLKIEDTNSPPNAEGNPSIVAEVQVNTTVINEWEILTFNMALDSRFNANNTYDQAVIFPDIDNPSVAGGESYYFDDIANEGGGTNPVEAVEIIPLTGEKAAIVAAMGRGINMGNTLEPPLEGSWNNGPAEEFYFDRYKEAGFTNVRIPVRWDQHTGNAAPYGVDVSWMSRVEEVVDWALERDFYVTLNGHHEDWLKVDYSASNIARYESIWRQIVSRFKDKSDKLLFEIINEPKGLTKAQVDDLNRRILRIIRADNPTRWVIYSGNEWSAANDLITAAIPADDYMIGYYHSYAPWSFAGMGEGTWGTSVDLAQLENEFKRVATWSGQNQMPIHLSEFGAVRQADYNSRMRHYAAYVELAVKYGFTTSVWDDGGMFGILDRPNDRWSEVKDILLYTYPTAPTAVTTSRVETPTGEIAIELNWVNRTTTNGDITIEKRTNAGDFVALTTVEANSDYFVDTEVAMGQVYTYRLFTTDADGTLLHGYPSQINLVSTVRAPYNNAPMEIPGRVEAENFDLGGEGLSYHDEDTGNNGGAYRPGEGVDIEDNGSNGFQVGWVAQGEWLEYTLTVKKAGTYSMTALLASEQPNGQMEISFLNGEKATFIAPNTGGWKQQTEVTASNMVTLPEGQQIMRMSITGTAPFNIDAIDFSLEQSTSTKDIVNTNISVFPNPFKDVLYVDLTANQLKNARFYLFTANGKMLSEMALTSNKIALQQLALPSGLYVVKIVAPSVQYRGNFVKH